MVVVVAGVFTGTQAAHQSDLDPAASRRCSATAPAGCPTASPSSTAKAAPASRRRSGGGPPGPAEITLSAYSTADPEWSQTALKIASIQDQILVHGRVAMVTG